MLNADVVVEPLFNQTRLYHWPLLIASYYVSAPVNLQNFASVIVTENASNESIGVRYHQEHFFLRVLGSHKILLYDTEAVNRA